MTGTDLADWLLARIAEDEAIAQVHLHSPGVEHLGPDSQTKITGARILAECDAKRRIVGICTADPMVPLTRSLSSLLAPSGGYAAGRHEQAEATLRLLALPYADRPGYREEWRP